MARRPGLTLQQRRVLRSIERFHRKTGHLPSLQEISDDLGYVGVSNAQMHIRTLEDKGYVRRFEGKARTMELLWDPLSGAQVERRPYRHVPRVGRVSGGEDLFAAENVSEMLPVPASLLPTDESVDLFIFEMPDDSMTDDAIRKGDMLLAIARHTAQNDDVIVGGLLDKPVGVWHYQRDRRTITLSCSNVAYPSMEVAANEVRVYGQVIMLMRQL